MKEPGRSPMPPPIIVHPDRREAIRGWADAEDIRDAPRRAPGSITDLKRRLAYLETLLTEAAQFLDTGDPTQDLLSERIYEALSARRGE